MTDYSEILRVLSRLPNLLKARREADGLSLRAAAREIGISASTLARAETYAGYLDAIKHRRRPALARQAGATRTERHEGGAA